MSTKATEILNVIKPRRVIYAILIGLFTASWMLYSNFDPKVFSTVSWSWSSTFWIFMAILMMMIRDLGYIIRIRILSEGKIKWRDCFDVIMLWEFASAVTPSVVGGSAVAVFFINKEGINMGRSSAIVLITALMDELFFVIMVPLVFLIVGQLNLFPVALEKNIFGMTLNIKGIFWTSYTIILIYVVTISYALLFKPRGFKSFLLRIFKLPFLRRWRLKALETGNEIIVASGEIRKQNAGYWVKAIAATFFSWTARYWVVNCLILAFIAVDGHFLIYARQLVMWIIMLISPTPGGSGIAEFAFSGFLKEFSGGLDVPLAVLWRLISYYPYLFIGVIVLPRWLRKVYSGLDRKEENKSTDDQSVVSK